MHHGCDHAGTDRKLFCEKCAAVRDSIAEPWRALTKQERARNVALYACFDLNKIVDFLSKEKPGYSTVVIACGGATLSIGIRVPDPDAEVDTGDGTTRPWHETPKAMDKDIN